MKATAMASNPVPAGPGKFHSRYKYHKVLDGRKQPIRGLWKRNGKFIARLTVENDSGKKEVRWKPLEGAETQAQAQAELRRLLTKRESNGLPVLKRTPKFSEYVDQYFAHLAKVKDAKRPATIQKERCTLDKWKEHLGDTRLDRINRAQVNAFVAKRQSDKLSGRTVNLDVISLRNVLKHAIDDGWIKSLPTENMRPLKWTPKTRNLFSAGDLDRLCSAAVNPLENDVEVSKKKKLLAGQKLKNGQQFSDYIRLMAYCGARRNETLRLKWNDVNWERKQLRIGSDGLSKNYETRFVDFNSNLEKHLTDMNGRRAPDSDFLFPSPQRGEKDRPAKTFMETLRLVRKVSGITNFGFHDCRHYFISYCVMSGIDYMTIARWAGHKDGGVLIGKVYGHLSNDHAQRQAQRLNFGPVISQNTALA